MMPLLVLDRGSNVSFGLRPPSHLLEVVVNVRSVVFWLCTNRNASGGSNVYVQRGLSKPCQLPDTSTYVLGDTSLLERR
jgi:hypothetical protein